ncbi:iron dicitrate transport regulator FecR [Methylobacterium tarhaniae]|uniref:Iron dicitrate transport regulator FecR n=1 Tax=Methylobacterium tarhaniae TaxID=1187852 RepID=A0A0J6VW53_9HYPH|nr:FecR family protein [Methylobacterium tarhaniae]KMO43536.1 iron dicitrate transport regulator FecR [Methylobacterium tarhaniae]
MAISDETDARDPNGEARDDEDPIDEAAAGWVVRLSSTDATEADRAAFEAWHAADPAHEAAYAEMHALWHRLGHLPSPAPGTRRRRARTGPACLAVALVLGAALAYRAGLADWLRADLWSGVGEIGHATLADGSRVDLNTGTALALHFTGTERRVALLRGEAVFDVAHDPGRPFIVEGGGVSVRAVGTVFFVRADGASQPVGVAEGRVEVTESGRRLQVSAGEAVRAQAGAAPAVVKADVARATAWRDGRLIVSGERLSDVLAELARYRRGRILLLDAKAGERRVTGAFDPRNTDDALDALAASLSLRVTRLTPLMVLVGSPL